jgi:hypothetical protein
MIRSRAILVFIGLALAATPALAGGDKHEGQIDVYSVGWSATQAPQAGKNDGGYVLTGVQHTARASSSLGSLRSLGSSSDLFANSRGGDQGAPVPRGPSGPSGTGKTISADLLGKNSGGTLADSTTKPPTQAMGDGSVRFIRDSITPNPSAKPGGGVPTGTVVFKVDGVAPTGAGGAAKGAALARK